MSVCHNPLYNPDMSCTPPPLHPPHPTLHPIPPYSPSEYATTCQRVLIAGCQDINILCSPPYSAAHPTPRPYTPPKYEIHPTLDPPRNAPPYTPPPQYEPHLPERPRSWLSMRRDSCRSVPMTISPPASTTVCLSVAVYFLYSSSIACSTETVFAVDSSSMP